jgi:DNA-binding NarL/FixJ family response regulator
MLAAVATSILIVEDHPATFLGLRAYIGALGDYEDLGAVTSGEDALALASELNPQLVCLDLALAGELDGFEVCERLSALPDPPSVVVYTGQEEPGIVVRAREAGALAVVAKSERHSEFGRALSLAAAGKPYTSPVFARALTVRELTARQRRVLELMALGLDNRQIAERMGLGAETVKTHVHAVLKKLEANDRTHAVAIGLRDRFIE